MKVAFIGVGMMGKPMAANLVKGGHEVLVHDADAVRAAAVAAETGATAVDKLAGLAGATVIVTMLPDGKAVQSVALGEHGIAHVARAGTIMIDMSSSQPLITRATGAALAARSITLIDAPVSGGIQRAITGTLTIMIGSDDPAAIQTVQPVLACMGNAFFIVGKLGAGHAAKALNNVVGASNYAVLAEALVVAERYGIDPAALVDIVNVSTGQSFASSVVMKQFVIPRTYSTGFKVGLLAKDVGIAADLSKELGCATPFIDLARQRWDEARDILGAEEDNSRAILAWESSKAR
jgi:3-hydroxyisobutyrate dehydrogenase